MSDKKVEQYEKAVVEHVQFDNSDVITTSGERVCWTNGHDKGNGCPSTSGDCAGQFWKDNRYQ